MTQSSVFKVPATTKGNYKVLHADAWQEGDGYIAAVMHPKFGEPYIIGYDLDGKNGTDLTNPSKKYGQEWDLVLSN
jgi:hypothetical protein